MQVATILSIFSENQLTKLANLVHFERSCFSSYVLFGVGLLGGEAALLSYMLLRQRHAKLSQSHWKCEICNCRLFKFKSINGFSGEHCTVVVVQNC